ncbi:tyrosine-type recombinase/integrase [Cerasicoccus maritimus]|uniref:tyrosine-type recombinase/integrase n=1 Tax=Cerasicoccus maritimus TaxID=490089 RepID=UPI0028528436|nr:tyrosine-type recombinase/integrase [Cerasicoccus maritimus]
MPIVDYAARARRYEARLFEDEEISKHNKTALRRFLVSYDVSAGRRSIFFDKIRVLLAHFPKVETALTDRDEVNLFFANLRGRYSAATYATYINVIRRFLTWLNDGEKPASLRDVKVGRNASRNKKLRAEDMMTWEEGVQLAEASGDIQMAAIILTQLDCGFRPSEFHELNYSCVKIENALAIIDVRDGKTGARSVVAHRCVPALMKWLDAHPSKRPEDPLWVALGSMRKLPGQPMRVQRYGYKGMVSRIGRIARKISLTKPLAFYPLRHSSCRLDKMANLPTDLAAERHGHTVKHFVGTYGRLSVDDVVRRFNSHYGRESESPSPVETIEHHTCSGCKMVLSKSASWCHKCGLPTSSLDAMERFHAQRQLNETSPDARSDEITLLKAELQSVREREQSLRNNQEELLKEMLEIRRDLTAGRNE